MELKRNYTVRLSLEHRRLIGIRAAMEGMSFTEYVEMVMVADATGERGRAQGTPERIVQSPPPSPSLPVHEQLRDDPITGDDLFCDDATFF